MFQTEAEQTSKKKKKKSKPGCKDVDPETHFMVLKQQEPPKFEVWNFDHYRMYLTITLKTGMFYSIVMSCFLI